MERSAEVFSCPEIMTHYHLTKEDVVGSYEWKGDMDLINIVMIGLAKELPGHNEMYELHRLLGALLSQELTAGEKLGIIGTEYNIPLEETLRKDVSVMCNLSQGIEEKGIAIGEARGKAIGEAIGEAKKEAEIILNMHKKGFSVDQIAMVTDKPIEEIEAILKGKEFVIQ